MSETTSTHHRSGRGRVIGLIVAGTVLVAGLGAVAGVVFDSDQVSHSVVTPPDNDVALRLGGGESAPQRVRSDGQTPDPNLTGTLHDVGFGPDVFIPDGWTVYNQVDTRLWAKNDKGSFAFVAGGKLQSADGVTAGGIIQQNLQGLLPPDSYTQLRTVGPSAWGGSDFGDVVSGSILEYQATWTDAQGSAPLYGQIYAAVRNDGAVLVVLIEHIPPDDWEATAYPRAAVVEQSMLRFAGLG